MSPERTIFKEIDEHVQAFLKVQGEFYSKGKIMAKRCVDEFFIEHPEIDGILFDCDNDRHSDSFCLRFVMGDKALYPHNFPDDTALGKCVRVLELSLQNLKAPVWDLYNLIAHDVIALKNTSR